MSAIKITRYKPDNESSRRLYPQVMGKSYLQEAEDCAPFQQDNTLLQQISVRGLWFGHIWNNNELPFVLSNIIQSHQQTMPHKLNC